MRCPRDAHNVAFRCLPDTGPAWAEGRTAPVMTIERGVKRILIVMSVLIVLLAAVSGWLMSPPEPYTILTVWCDPAHRYTMKTRLSEKELLQLSGPEFYKEFRWPPDFVPMGCEIAKTDKDGMKFIPRSWSYRATLKYRWMRDLILPVTGWTLAALALLWGAFYTLRWIVRGFSRPS